MSVHVCAHVCFVHGFECVRMYMDVRVCMHVYGCVWVCCRRKGGSGGQYEGGVMFCSACRTHEMEKQWLLGIRLAPRPGQSSISSRVLPTQVSLVLTGAFVG